MRGYRGELIFLNNFCVGSRYCEINIDPRGYKGEREGVALVDNIEEEDVLTARRFWCLGVLLISRKRDYKLCVYYC